MWCYQNTSNYGAEVYVSHACPTILSISPPCSSSRAAAAHDGRGFNQRASFRIDNFCRVLERPRPSQPQRLQRHCCRAKRKHNIVVMDNKRECRPMKSHSWKTSCGQGRGGVAKPYFTKLGNYSNGYVRSKQIVFDLNYRFARII